MNNPYPPTITDEASGVEVNNPLHEAYALGHEAGYMEREKEYQDGTQELFQDYSADAAEDDWKRDQVAKEGEE
jgi:hypothetical protein